MSDLERWHALWQALGATNWYDFEVLDELKRCYAESRRIYHTFEHIRDCLRQFDAARSLARRPTEVEVAIWFHDAIYDPKRRDNEERSARWAARALREAGVSTSVATRVRELILTTRHDPAPAGRAPIAQAGQDPALLTDIDLSILGRTPAVFDRYQAQIRQEYAWLPDEAFQAGRAGLLRGLLARDRIYQTDYFYQRFETQARRNLVRALGRLKGS